MRAIRPAHRLRTIRMLRGPAAALAFTALLTACGTSEPVPFAGESPAATAPTPSSGVPAASAGPAGSTPRPGEPAQPGAVSPTAAPATDGGDPGHNAAAYLRGDVPKLVVEVDAVKGRGPRPGTLDLVRTRLAALADKPGGIRFLPVQSIPAHGGAWSLADLHAAEKRYRNTHNAPDTASLYLLFVDGAAPKQGAIGLAYTASSAAIFSDQIADAATLLVGATAIEHADTVHEVGHLLSLVNLGYTSPRPHEDAQHPNHSDNPDSVMYWAVDNVGVATLLGGRTEPPTEFDADDVADLRAVRSGELP